jgi:PhnB protein
MSVKPIPEGYRTANVYLTIKNAPEAIEFYKKAFGAVELMRLEMAPGQIAHAEIQMGDTILMITEENLEWGNPSPATLGGTAVGMMLYVEDADAVFAQAVAAGSTVRMPVENQFWGDRMGQVVDPYGHIWSIATHVEEVSLEECQARMHKLYGAAA